MFTETTQGGALGFGPDDKLYVTVGMGSHPKDPQVISSPVGKISRINRDGSIPKDNPFPNSAVYTLGHRNMYGIAFDKNGRGLITENGDSHFDELNLIKKGANLFHFALTLPYEFFILCWLSMIVKLSFIACCQIIMNFI